MPSAQHYLELTELSRLSGTRAISPVEVTMAELAAAAALGIARRSAYYVARARPHRRHHRAADPTVLQQIRAVTNSRATYGLSPGVGDGEPTGVTIASSGARGSSVRPTAATRNERPDDGVRRVHAAHP